MTWVTKSSRVAYENAWIRVREDEVSRPAGEDGVYGVVEVRHPAVFVVALDADDRVLLVEVDRYTVGRSWEVVAGGSDGEAAEQAARRELLEESGLEAGEWHEVGQMNALNGICIAPEVVFVARDLRLAADAAAHQAEEGITASRWVPLPDALRMTVTGEITDGETIAALAMAAVHLRAL
ncbi:NUDIX hydrolase [Microbacterium betulae]|uniref:NUDIX hydrolase n=1 Tax=Microbacterium betulae TaxID=2981139 RepID=A0AA97I6X0_9MICO|nr:NUDIX hydrolase [Microbacterium sp. AB]WOF22830.1 NUDIX hydrolase [Microbacterium sp. AB]